MMRSAEGGEGGAGLIKKSSEVSVQRDLKEMCVLIFKVGLPYDFGALPPRRCKLLRKSFPYLAADMLLASPPLIHT